MSDDAREKAYQQSMMLADKVAELLTAVPELQTACFLERDVVIADCAADLALAVKRRVDAMERRRWELMRVACGGVA